MNYKLILLLLTLTSCYEVKVKEHPLKKKNDCPILTVDTRDKNLYRSKYPELAYEILTLKRTEEAINKEMDLSEASDEFLNKFEYSKVEDSILIKIDSILDKEIEKTLLLINI